MLVNMKVGDENQDHVYLERPNAMDTARTVLKIDRNNPITHVAELQGTTLAIVNGCSYPVWPIISNNPVLNVTKSELKKGYGLYWCDSSSKSYMTGADCAKDLELTFKCQYNTLTEKTNVISIISRERKQCNRRGIVTGLHRLWVYTKPQGQQTDFGDPVVLSADKGGCSAEDFCNQIHRSLVKEVKYVLVWGSSARHSPQHCGLSHVLQDEDVVQIINKKEKVGGNKNKGLSYG
ncbi:P-loop containing nucleoside triphosphate hydrolases superfamily protein [Artemisia annua]|uniref:P-loop containing nucleoside triphosphate hydrolases superfamily protein n=1 Tax=Artemisia annua TaxID=35608 RepID=A0A2U1PFU8_ARTAN|nr:P-loop containing nucleoside triphosphate hydrolases superfamily protein [Artemisia annua]